MTKFGIYLINKPKGITSHDVVNYLRRVTGEKTIGHAGTLDPLASGLIIVAIGREFTRRISEFSKLDKTYLVEAILGATSTTYDAEGEIRTSPNLPLVRGGEVGLPSVEDIEKILQSFTGKQEQMPPIFSAKKIKGQKAYDLARQGKTVELKAVPVNIHEIKLLDYQYPVLKFSAEVSSGTYIRSLVHDIGQKLEVGAYMSGLIRDSIGEFKLSGAIDLHQIKSPTDLHPTNSPLIRGRVEGVYNKIMKKYIIWLLVGVVVGAGGYWLYQQYNFVPVNSPEEQMTILVYFAKSEPTDIAIVPVQRTIPTTKAVATAALEELLKGPTDAEKAAGLTTAINSGTVLNYVRIENGVAIVDFNDRFDFQMGGSARVMAINQQILKTLTQFPTVKSIKITINNGERPANLEP